MRAIAIVLAAGQGSRLKEATGGLAKQFLPWQGVPLYWHSALTFSRSARVAGLVFVFPEGCLEQEQKRLEKLDTLSNLGLPWAAVAGGARRQDSVANGLACIPRLKAQGAGHVLVHDAARPFVSAELVNRVIDALEHGACGVIPGIAVTDTIKQVDAEDRVVDTPERSMLRAVQTPQGFDTGVLLRAHELALQHGWSVTDDAALLDKCGFTTMVVAGEPANSKITNPEDMAMLTVAQRQDTTPCNGFGYDVHKFVPSGEDSARPMKIGGVRIPDGPGVLAHSDGDVLLHALADALLGCCGEGDIGKLFPDTDPSLATMNSAIIVDEALSRAESHGIRVTHADLTIIAQIPKIGPFRDEIRNNIARLLRLPQACVNVKATTEEGLGFTGSREGIKAVAMVSAVRAGVA